MSACEAGYTWTWDGVVFTFMHPVTEAATQPHHSAASKNEKKSRKNAQSCVLHIRGTHHSAFLSGDIGVKQELEILQRIDSGQAQHAALADVVLVGHHGSTTSSSPIFVLRSRAKHAIAQAGYLNRFSHPALEVEERWKASRATFWRTDNHGAVTVKSTQQGLNVEAESRFRKRYWHERID
jgi:competence protein ComEC